MTERFLEHVLLVALGVDHFDHLRGLQSCGVQLLIGFVKLAKKDILSELNARERDTELLAHHVIQVPLPRQKAFRQSLNRYSSPRLDLS